MERSPWSGRVLDVVYRQLPHLVVDYGCYAITMRCTGSLPAEVGVKLREFQNYLRKIEPRSREFATWQRRIFLTVEKYLDTHQGFSPFFDESIAELCFSLWRDWKGGGERVFRSLVIMPNHVHALTRPMTFSSCGEFMRFWKRLKASTARKLNQAMCRRGAFWQKEWYDRWVRSEVEYARWVKYIQDNPVGSRLVRGSEPYRWLK